MRQGRRLQLVDPTREGLSDAIATALRQGLRHVRVSGGSEDLVGELESVVRAHGGQVSVAPENADVFVLAQTERTALDAALHECIDLRAGVVIAPRTSRGGEQQIAFGISPPKAGTHMLFSLLRAFGYDMGYTAGETLRPRHWYYLEYTNAHTGARDFFVDSVRRAIHGHRLHPFPRFPTIFLYRNPLDVVVSESRYNHRDGATLFSGYLRSLDDEARLLRLIDDPWLLGSIRDRTGAYIPWLDFPSVIPVSFEELVGPQGGGDAQAQLDALWSLQLKLHVPGDPAVFAKQIFDRDSPTFAEGKIGGHRQYFTPACWERFEALPQDFMAAFGYDRHGTLPSRRHVFRTRRLELSNVDHAETQVLVDFDYLDHVIVREQGQYRAVPKGRPWGDPQELRAATLPEVHFRIGLRKFA